ncbi:alkaline phosphatase family protein [Actinomyces sp. ZJ308]|uniref:alkaline phosphatase family protein n=1 Tax=Actinomyces sp. ZJ308 TaxID=2708342 RepID=UPI0014230038|nr:alkaline phosphatase family protein [Actinomyces sp. ZJ308]
MRSRTVAEEPSPAPASDSPQDPALRYVLAVGAVSAGLTLSDPGNDGGSDGGSVVTDAEARHVARSWGVAPADGLGDAPGDGPGTVVVLVDGLGLEMLRQRRGHTPTLRRWLGQGDNGHDSRILTCRPSTTAAALTMLGTSALPGTTGMVGYSVLKPRLGPALPASTVPGPDQILSLITWKGDDAPSPRAWQDVPTVFERLPAGSAVSIGPARFAGSGLTEAALRGASHLGADRLEDRPGLAAGALRRGTPLVYLYVGELDKIGHKHGWLSEQWLAQLERLDAAMTELARRVPAGTRIILSTDHGMVDTDADHRIDLSAHRELTRDVVAVAGEPRLTHLHVADGDADLAAEVAHRYRRVLGDRAAWIGTREQAAEHLGTLSPRARGVVGDVVVAMAGTWVLVDPRVHSESAIAMPGVHGSFTPAETEVPLLITEA